MFLELNRIHLPPWLATIFNAFELAFIVSCITVLRLIAPLSLAYLAFSLYLWKPVWTIWLLIPSIPEAFFFLFVYLPRREFLQKQARHQPPPLSKDEREALFQRCLAYIPTTSPSLFPTGWFLPPEAVNRHNVLEWLAYALFARKLENIQEEHQIELEGYANRLELARGEAFPEGRAQKTKLMELSFQRVPMCHRPLVWYLIIGIVDHFSAIRLLLLGFRHYVPPGTKRWRTFPFRLFTLFSRTGKTGNVSFWHRPAPSDSVEDPKPAVMLFHGIGIGMFPYVPFVASLIKKSPQQDYVLVEVLQISSRMAGPLPARDNLLTDIGVIIDSLNLKRVMVVANSFGTLIASTIIRAQNAATLNPEEFPLHRIKQFILVDMAAFCLHLGDLARNFMFRSPGWASYEWVIWYFSSRDADVSRTLSRHFFWHEFALWKEDLLS
ncbi:hypothetical protein DL96DRAFT_1670307 [Flagelloscypha sp. PMI_526]|nr:hypothetical protein DL96DRAFT_1670307 [Flagelloscypha sp. PMI_526]